MRKLLKRWRWIVGGGFTLLVAGAVTLWLMFQHIPDWYRPVQVPPDEVSLQRIRNDLTSTMDRLSTALNEPRGPFTFQFTQDQVNAWLSAREAIDPKSREWLPAVLSDPMVVFEPGCMRVAATYSDERLHAVVSAKLALEANADGLSARLEEVAGGSLALPSSWVRDALKAYDRQMSPKLSQVGLTARDRRFRVRDLVEGVAFSNLSRLPGGGQRFRILGLSFEPGILTVTLERLPYQPERAPAPQLLR